MNLVRIHREMDERAFLELENQVGPVAVVDDTPVRDLVRDREIALKRDRSRFTNESRLLDWTGHSGVGRFDFRWFRVRQLLTDLHRGLEA